MRLLKTLLYFLPLLIWSSCDQEDLSFTISPAIGFAESAALIKASQSLEHDIQLRLNAETTTSATITVTVVGINGFKYGIDFTTVPEASSGSLVLDVPEGASEVAITYKGITTDIPSNRTILFQIESASGLALGQSITQQYSLVLTPLAPVSYEYDFEGCTTDYAIPNGFSEIIVPGYKTDRGWGCRVFGNTGTRGVRASAFGGTDGEDNAWLVTDHSVNLLGYANVNLSFDVISVYDGPGSLVVQWSDDYDGISDPTGYTWHVLSEINAQLPATGSNSAQNVSGSISGISGDKFYLAFQYVGGTSAASSSWDIDNLILSGN